MKAIEISFVNHYKGDMSKVGYCAKKVDGDIYHLYKHHKTFIGAILTATRWYYIRFRKEVKLKTNPTLQKIARGF